MEDRRHKSLINVLSEEIRGHTSLSTALVCCNSSALDISTGYICRASRFQIVLARTMTNHRRYFSGGRPPHISAVFAQSFCYSETPAWRESESGMSIKHTDVSVYIMPHAILQCEHPIRIWEFSPRSTWHGSE